MSITCELPGLRRYGIAAKFIVASATIAVTLQAMHRQKYSLAILFGALALAWRNSKIASRAAVTATFVLGAVSAATPAVDVSKYRNFQLGMDLTAVSAQAGEKATQAKLITARPARVQELEWLPQSAGTYSETEAAKTVLFSFYNDQLYRITVDYDRYRIEGLTADDIAEAVSQTYGTNSTHPVPGKAVEGSYATPDDVVARWEDADHRVDLIRLRYGPPFRLVVTAKSLEPTVQAALLEAKRLDAQEAPQREAARAVEEAQSEQARLEKLRLVNKPKFRP
jgi:hypothetical protein